MIKIYFISNIVSINFVEKKWIRVFLNYFLLTLYTS